jgi:hypothetical protein
MMKEAGIIEKILEDARNTLKRMRKPPTLREQKNTRKIGPLTLSDLQGPMIIQCVFLGLSMICMITEYFLGLVTRKKKASKHLVTIVS